MVILKHRQPCESGAGLDADRRGKDYWGTIRVSKDCEGQQFSSPVVGARFMMQVFTRSREVKSK